MASGAAAGSGDRIELAPLRGAGTSPRRGDAASSSARGAGGGSGSGGTGHGGRTGHGRAGHGHREHRERGERERDREGGERGERGGTGKKNPLSIGSIISDQRDD